MDLLWLGKFMISEHVVELYHNGTDDYRWRVAEAPDGLGVMVVYEELDQVQRRYKAIAQIGGFDRKDWEAINAAALVVLDSYEAKEKA